jgi:hypothetical protein
MVQVTTVGQAIQAADRNVDVIIAQGSEAGGYSGTISTMAARTGDDPLQPAQIRPRAILLDRRRGIHASFPPARLTQGLPQEPAPAKAGVRYFGLWHPANRELAARVRLWLALDLPPAPAAAPHGDAAAPDSNPRAATGGSAQPPACLQCQIGHLVLIRRSPHETRWRREPPLATPPTIHTACKPCHHLPLLCPSRLPLFAAPVPARAAFSVRSKPFPMRHYAPARAPHSPDIRPTATRRPRSVG